MRLKVLLPLLALCLIACTAKPVERTGADSSFEPAQAGQPRGESGSTDDDPKSTSYPEAPKPTVIGQPTPVPPPQDTPVPQPTHAPTSTPFVPDVPATPSLPDPAEPVEPLSVPSELPEGDIDTWLAQLTTSFGDYENLRVGIDRLIQQATLEALTGKAGATLEQVAALSAELERLTAEIGAYPVPAELAVLQQRLVTLFQETMVAVNALVDALSAQNTGQEGAAAQIQEALAALARVDELLDAFRSELDKFN